MGGRQGIVFLYELLTHLPVLVTAVAHSVEETAEVGLVRVHGEALLAFGAYEHRPLALVVLDHRQLRAHGLGGFLLSDLDRTELDLLAAFRLIDHRHGPVHIRFNAVHETWVFLQGFLPAVHKLGALRREPGR